MYIFQNFYALPSSRCSRRLNDRGGTGRGLAVSSLRNALRACIKYAVLQLSAVVVRSRHDTIRHLSSVVSVFSGDLSVDGRESFTIDVTQRPQVRTVHTQPRTLVIPACHGSQSPPPSLSTASPQLDAPLSCTTLH